MTAVAARSKLGTYFEFERYETNLGREVLAGTSTYLALAYIIVVNPAILSEAGMDKSFVFFATIVASAAATLVMGLWARLPFALAPGLEMSIYVAFVVVGTMGYSWQEALGAVFWSGVVFLILTVTRVRERIIDAIPDAMRSGIAFAVALFIVLIALRTAGIIEYAGTSFDGFGDFVSAGAFALYGGIALILILERFGLRAAVLLGILAVTVALHVSDNFVRNEDSVSLSSEMFDGIGQLDLSVILDSELWPVILLLFVIDFYGSIAKFIGLTEQTNIARDGRLPRMTEALSIDGAATVAGSGLGTTSITTFVESGVGIGAGGRTGLTAVVCGLLLSASILIAPLIEFVPIEATTGALIYVGIKLAPTLKILRGYSWVDLFALASMSVITVTTFALDRAMLTGFVIYMAADFVAYLRAAGEPDRRKLLPSPYLVASVVVIGISTAYQVF